jgi:hypothetical protein
MAFVESQNELPRKSPILGSSRCVRGRYGLAGLARTIPSTAGVPTPTSETVLASASTSTAQGVPLAPKA